MNNRLSVPGLCLAITIALAALPALATTAADTAAEMPAGKGAKAAPSRTAEDPHLVWTASSVVLVSRQVAPNVYAVYPDDAQAKNAAGIPAATSGGFVIGEKGVLVIETMLNRRLAGQMLALVRARTAKPITYVVNTSYHGDHAYGNQFFPKTAKIIQHVNTQAYIQAHFADDVKFMKQYFGTNQGLDELKPQHADILLGDGGSIDLDLGGKSVRVMHIGFAQTEGDLFVWLPGDKVVFTGNPIISGGPSLPWLLDGKLDQALATLKKLRALLPGDAVVVPGHGYPAGAESIDYPIGYLGDLRQKVAEAVGQGLSEEATVARLNESMKQYNGYRIFGWVHSQINVPKTYREIKGGKP